MVDPIQTSVFENSFIIYILMPFLLVFVLVFAILEKANILGEGKRAANVIIAAVIAFIFVGVPSIVGVTLKLIPIISLVLIILLCMLLMFGFVGIQIPENKGIKIVLGIVLGLILIGVILWATGVIQKIHLSSSAIQYIILFAIFGGALALVVSTSGKKSSSTSS
jgi:hypothetical protein